LHLIPPIMEGGPQIIAPIELQGFSLLFSY
jgi:hypothetical protein